MIATFRALLTRFVPEAMRQQCREFLDLPRNARRAWLSALLRRVITGRDITSLPNGLPDCPHILVVCYGNIYRSPYAEARLRLTLAKRPWLHATTTSVGLLGTHGRPCPADAQALARTRGVGLSEHRSTSISEEAVARADIILLMDRRNEALLRARYPGRTHKMVLLGAFDPLGEQLGPVISDPYGCGSEALDSCYLRIERSVARLVNALGGRDQVRSRNRIKRAARRAATSSLLSPIWKGFTSKSAAIFMLHRFENREEGTWGLSSELLAAQLEYLRSEKFHICSVDEIVSRALAGQPLHPRTVAFTVDDGYADFARVGAPLFARFDVPVTLFVTTRFVDGTHWMWYDAVAHLCKQREKGNLSIGNGKTGVSITWSSPHDRVPAVRKAVERMKGFPLTTIGVLLSDLQNALGVSLPATPTPRFAAMTWDDIARCERYGVTFGSHTENHAIVARETADNAEREISLSVRRLKERTTSLSKVFAYPNGLPGDFTSRDEALVAEAGCSAAVTSTGGHCTAADILRNRYAISRVPYSEDFYVMRSHLLGIERARALVGLG